MKNSKNILKSILILSIALTLVMPGVTGLTTYNYEFAELELEIGEIIGGLLGISAEIKNNGTSNATNVVSSIVLDGGIIFIGREISENIGTIEAGGIGAIFDVPVLGFGPVEITITARADGVEEVTRIGKGFVLLFYIMISIS